MVTEGHNYISGGRIFDESLLENTIINNKSYIIGVDTGDKDTLSYCLSRKVDDCIEILLCRTMRDEVEFNKVVEDLSKYFNAPVSRNGEFPLSVADGKYVELKK